jgi:hypothetical protein
VQQVVAPNPPPTVYLVIGTDPYTGQYINTQTTNPTSVMNPPPRNRDWFQSVSDFSAAMGDTVSCGLTRRIRQGIGYDGVVDYNSRAYGAGVVAGEVVNVGLSFASPCRLAAGGWRFAAQGVRSINYVQAAGNAVNAGQAFATGDVGSGLTYLASAYMSASSATSLCFAAGTPILTPTGHKAIEDFRPGDLILSAPEYSPEAPVEVKKVEQLFVNRMPVLELHTGGKIIRTTAEHPFFVYGRGWTAAQDLMPGDRLRSHNDQLVVVDKIVRSEELVSVYNVQVADYHTYFVGTEDWGFSVWSHNTCTRISQQNGQTTLQVLNPFRGGSAESRQLQRFVASWNQQIVANGGSMMRRALTAAQQRLSRAWTRQMSSQARFANRVVGHVPDAAAGGAVSGGPAMALLRSVNSYLGGILTGIPRGTVYNRVILFR